MCHGTWIIGVVCGPEGQDINSLFLDADFALHGMRYSGGQYKWGVLREKWRGPN